MNLTHSVALHGLRPIGGSQTFTKLQRLSKSRWAPGIFFDPMALDCPTVVRNAPGRPSLGL